MKYEIAPYVFACTTALLVAAAPVYSQQDMQNVKIEMTDLGSGLYMMTGRGGNLGLSIGDDGAFLIDDQYAPLTEKILAAISSVTEEPVRFVINTHWHGDHVGGNENMGEAGAIIVAHENVRVRMSTEQFNRQFNRTTPASPPEALPVITFSDEITFHWNNDDINVFHIDPAHTDGDAIIRFRKANVIHMGDTFFNGSYPYIDVSSGGRIDGLINGADRVLALIDNQAKIIPGHGALAGKADLKEYRDMLADVRNKIASLIQEGKSMEEIIALKPTSQYDDKWGNGYMQPDRWVSLVHASMSGQ